MSSNSSSDNKLHKSKTDTNLASYKRKCLAYRPLDERDHWTRCLFLSKGRKQQAFCSFLGFVFVCFYCIVGKMMKKWHILFFPRDMSLLNKFCASNSTISMKTDQNILDGTTKQLVLKRKMTRHTISAWVIESNVFVIGERSVVLLFLWLCNVWCLMLLFPGTKLANQRE